MATFIPEVQANLPEVKLYTPPFEMIANFLDVKQQRYDAAAMQLGSYYSQLKQLPLTLEDNVLRRDQFIQDAEAQVKKLAEVDLSMPENYRAARNIFNPLLEDEDIMTDLTFSLNQQALVSANQRFKNSPKEEDRKRYNPNNDTYVALKRQEFINATPEQRKQMSGQGSRFVNNVNIFEIAQEIAKENGLNIEWTSNPTTSKGGIPQVIFKGKNGERVVGYAYNKLMGVIGNNPYVKEYYSQLGYINVQSELQQLIPQLGYEGALEVVSSKYQSLNSKPGEDAEALARAESDKYVASSVVATAEDKISKSGIIPGSKQHLDYIKSVNKLEGATEETSNLVAKSYNSPVQAQSLNDLYSIAGSVAFQGDLQNAAIDMAMTNSSRELIQNPLFLTSLKLREVQAKEMEAMAKANPGPSGGESSFQERLNAAGGDNVSVIESIEADNKVEAIVSSLAKEASDLMLGDDSKFAQTVSAYVAAGGKFDGIGGANPGKSIVTEINNLVEAGNRSEALSKISQYMEIMQAGVDNGSITGPAVIKLNELTNIKNGLNTRYEEFRNSLVEIVPAFKQEEVSRADGIFTNMPAVAEIVDYLIDSNGGIRTKDEFGDALQEALIDGQLDQQTVNFLASGATIRATDSVIFNKASELYAEAVKNGSTEGGVKYDPNSNTIKTFDMGSRKWVEKAMPDRLSITTGYGGVSPTIANKYKKLAEEYFATHPEELAAVNQGNRIDYNLTGIYNDIYSAFSRRYEQAGNYTPLTGVVEIDNGSYAVERMSTRTLVSPTNSTTTRYANEELMITANDAIKNGSAYILNGTLKQNVVGKDELSSGSKRYGQNLNGNDAYDLWNQFIQDYARETSNEKKDGATSARASMTILSNLKLGDERYTAIELSPTQDWLSSNISGTDNDKPGKLPITNTTSATILIPQDIVRSSGAKLPTTDDELLYGSVINGGYDLTLPNLADGRINVNNQGELNFDVYFNQFDPETGKYNRIPYQNNGVLSPSENNVVNFTYYHDDILQTLNLLSIYNDQAVNTYNQQNGAVYGPEALKQ